jgi:hypothetical protein
MKRYFTTIGIVIFLLSSTGYAARERWILAKRVDSAELIVVGELGRVERNFSIVFESLMAGLGADHWHFKVGSISIDHVLAGHLSPGELRDSIVSIALADGLENQGKHVTRFPGRPTAYEGDRGIWLLKRGVFIGHWGFATHDCFLPLDSLEAVKLAIERLKQKKGH